MKKLILTVVFMLLAVCPVLAATDDFLSSMDFKGTSGFSAGVMMLNLGALGTQITQAGYPALPGTMVIYGGNSLLGFKNGLRWGAFGYGGQVKGTQGEALSLIKMGAGGGNFEYGHAFTSKLDASAGLLLGAGSYQLTLRKNVADDINQPNVLYLTNGYFLVGPRVAVQYKVTNWLAIQLMGGYMYGIGDDRWKDTDVRTDKIPGLRFSSPMAMINFNLNY